MWIRFRELYPHPGARGEPVPVTLRAYRRVVDRDDRRLDVEHHRVERLADAPGQQDGFDQVNGAALGRPGDLVGAAHRVRQPGQRVPGPAGHLAARVKSKTNLCRVPVGQPP